MLDSVEEIKSFLEQNPESVFITSYHLEFNNKPINEYVQLSEIPGLRDGSILHMVEGTSIHSVLFIDISRALY
jgi:hypothetical protein